MSEQNFIGAPDEPNPDGGQKARLDLDPAAFLKAAEMEARLAQKITLAAVIAERDAARAQAAALAEALTRQTDNMAFVLNRVDVAEQWFDRFGSELRDDRAALAAYDAQKETGE
jgi:hypothetical protein